MRERSPRFAAARGSVLLPRSNAGMAAVIAALWAGVACQQPSGQRWKLPALSHKMPEHR
ncbi:hypothetical protein MES5069_1270051 [Mesorhizobium escarrei]|uniref:Uncharacterized protein n=1 Tax=Mesorhizobium escarrei TaxID=666018 RepID=A0ABM9DHC1_9HYPH|nr:hypothetical protein MES5069_1270051 [Mesorhizobium escarrei]